MLAIHSVHMVPFMSGLQHNVNPNPTGTKGWGGHAYVAHYLEPYGGLFQGLLLVPMVTGSVQARA